MPFILQRSSDGKFLRDRYGNVAKNINEARVFASKGNAKAQATNRGWDDFDVVRVELREFPETINA